MCTVNDKCVRTPNYWVMTRRPVDMPGDPSVGVAPFTTDNVSILSCGSCLPTAVGNIGKINRDAAKGMHNPSRDGVVVKVKTPGGAWL